MGSAAMILKSRIRLETVDAAIDPDIRIRPPAANSISITPVRCGDDGPVRSGNGDDAVAASVVTVTALRTAGICAR